MRRKAGKNVTVKNRSIRARLTAVTVTVCADAVTAAGTGEEELSDRTGSSPFLWFALLFVIGVGALTVYGIAGKKSRHRPTPEKPNNTSIKRCRKAQTWFFGVFFCGAPVKA